MKGLVTQILLIGNRTSVIVEMWMPKKLKHI